MTLSLRWHGGLFFVVPSGLSFELCSSSKKPFPSMTSIWCPWLGLLNSVVSRKTSGPQAREKNGNSKEKIKKGNLQYYWLLTVQKSGKLTSWGWEFIYHYLRWVFVASQVGFLAGFLNRQQYLLSLLKWICWVADIWMATGGSHKVVVVESYEWTNTCEACAMKLLKFFFIIDDMACGKCVGIAIGFSTLRSFIR